MICLGVHPTQTYNGARKWGWVFLEPLDLSIPVVLYPAGKYFWSICCYERINLLRPRVFLNTTNQEFKNTKTTYKIRRLVHNEQFYILNNKYDIERNRKNLLT